MNYRIERCDLTRKFEWQHKCYYSFEPKSPFLWKNCQIALLSIGFSGRIADLFWAKTVDYTAADHL